MRRSRRVPYTRENGQNLALQPGDVITVFSQKDMQVPIGQQTKFIRLESQSSLRAEERSDKTRIPDVLSKVFGGLRGFFFEISGRQVDEDNDKSP